MTSLIYTPLKLFQTQNFSPAICRSLNRQHQFTSIIPTVYPQTTYVQKICTHFTLQSACGFLFMLSTPIIFIFPSSGTRLCVLSTCVCVCVCVCFTFVDKPDVSVTGIKSDTIHVTMMMMFKSIRWRLDIVIGSSSCTDTTSKTDYSIIHLQIIRFLHDRVTPTLYETRRFITVFTKVTTCLH